MNFASLAKKGVVAVAVTGTIVMVANNVQYKGDLISGLNGKLSTLESMLGTYSTRYNKDKGTIEGLRGQLESANGKVTSLQSDLTTLAGALGVKMDDSMGFDTTEKYNALKSAINTKITDLKNKADSDTELKAVAGILGCADTDDISDTVQDLFNNYSEAQAEVTRLEGELKSANNQATSLQGELDKANKEIARLEKVISDYEGDLGSATTKAQGIIDGKQKEIDEISKDTTEPSNPGGVQGNAKTEAYAKLTGTAKTLADNGYEEGDIYASPSGNYYLYTFAKCAGAKDTLGLVDVSTSTPRYYTTALNITAEQFADLNAWAKIPANN